MESEVLGIVNPGVLSGNYGQLRVVHVVMDKDKADRFAVGDKVAVVLPPCEHGNYDAHKIWPDPPPNLDDDYDDADYLPVRCPGADLGDTDG